MKYLLTFNIFICILTGVALAQEKIEGSIHEANSIFSKAIKSGKILVVDIHRIEEPVRFMFKSETQLLLISGDPLAVEKMLNEELRVEKDHEKYISENLRTIFRYCFVPSKATVLDQVFLKREEENLVHLDDPKLLPTIKKELQEIDLKYSQLNSVKVSENNWSLVLYIGINDGSVRKYHWEGSVVPFKITRNECETVAKEASFSCFLEF
jgi:hypothetical protein